MCKHRQTIATELTQDKHLWIPGTVYFPFLKNIRIRLGKLRNQVFDSVGTAYRPVGGGRALAFTWAWSQPTAGNKFRNIFDRQHSMLLYFDISYKSHDLLNSAVHEELYWVSVRACWQMTWHIEFFTGFSFCFKLSKHSPHLVKRHKTHQDHV